MGYLLLSVALFSGAIKGFCGKKTSFAVTTASDSIVINTLRMLLCIVIGFFLTVAQGGMEALLPDGSLLLVAALSGISSALFVISWLLSVRSGAYMMVEVFLLLGVTVPLFFCRFFFGERIGIWQLVGVLLLLAAIFIMCTYNTSLKGKMSRGTLGLLALCGLANGLSDFSQKLFVKIRPDGRAAAFQFYTYAFAAAFLLVSCLVLRRSEEHKGTPQRSLFAVVKPIWMYVVIMAVMLFVHSYFKTWAARYLDAIHLYPLNQGGGILLSLLMSALFFREKINLKCVAGVCLSFVALLLINLL